MALDWITVHNWEFYHYQAAEFVTAPADPDYIVPTRTKALYNVRVLGGNARPLKYIEKSVYDRMVFDQSAGDLPFGYMLAKLQTEATITLVPTPISVETVLLSIYKEPVKETDLNKTLDIASWMERPIILHAQGLVTKWRGGQGGLSMQLLQMAEDALQDTLIRDRDVPDEEPRLISQYEHALIHYPWTHPNREVY